MATPIEISQAKRDDAHRAKVAALKAVRDAEAAYFSAVESESVAIDEVFAARAADKAPT